MRGNIVLIGLTGFFMLNLVGCSITEKKTNMSSQSIQSEISISEKEKSTNTSVKDSATTESTTLSKNDKVKTMLDSLNQGMSGMFDISFDEANDKFVLDAKKDGPMDKVLSELVNNPTSDDKQQLDELSSSLTGFSESISSSLGNDYSIELLNHYNDQGSFFVIKNGEISFPYLEN